MIPLGLLNNRVIHPADWLSLSDQSLNLTSFLPRKSLGKFSPPLRPQKHGGSTSRLKHGGSASRQELSSLKVMTKVECKLVHNDICLQIGTNPKIQVVM